jgi:tyrosyl-tRNA synthetase
MQEHHADPSARRAQKKLAQEVTMLVHGEDALADAEEISDVLFNGGDLHGIDIELLKGSAPNAHISPGTMLTDALVDTGLAASKREARQFLSDGAITLNGEKVEDRPIEVSDFTDGAALLKRGKRNVAVLVQS